MDKLFQLTKKSFKDLGVKTYKDLWNRLRKEGKKGLQISSDTKFTKSEDSKNVFHTVFSSQKEDRHGDIVYQNFELKNFKKNPVLLDSHNYRSIENVVGKVKGIKVEKKKLQGNIEFNVDNPLGELARNMVDKGFLNTTSIGFRPLEFDDKGNILKSELLEISVVSVPANPDALIDKKKIDEKKKKEGGKKEKKEKKDDGKKKSEKKEKKEKKDDKNIKIVIDGVDHFIPNKKEFENWDETNEEVRMKVKDITEFDRPLERVVLVESVPKIYAMVGKIAGGGPMGIQMLFFPKSEGWTTDDARKWFIEWQMAMASPRKEKKKEVKKEKTSQEKIIEGIKSIQDTKTRGLARINKAVKAICSEAIKVEPKLGKKAEANRLINNTLKNLLKLKE